MGYEDGEKIPFAELLYVVERIIRNIKIPLSVDIETGYGSSDAEIFENIASLYKLGVVGINIEDSSKTSAGELIPVDVFAARINYLKTKMQEHNICIFINARTDAFLLNLCNPLQETLRRITALGQAGAGGIFIPFIEDENDIRKVVAVTTLPVNIMTVAGLPSLEILSAIGVKRISMGNFLYNTVYNSMEGRLRKVIGNGSFDALF